MKVCEICGKKTKGRWVVSLENSKVRACEECKSHGRVIRKEKKKKKKSKKQKTKKKKTQKETETEKVITRDHGSKIKKEREERELTQEGLASQINEQESQIRKIEKEKIEPTRRLAKKLEKKLDITLLTKPKKIKVKKDKKKEKKITIGDVIELKGEK